MTDHTADPIDEARERGLLTDDDWPEFRAYILSSKDPDFGKALLGHYEQAAARLLELDDEVKRANENTAGVLKLLDDSSRMCNENADARDAEKARADALQQQAEQWAMEAKTQRATVQAAYQVCTGSTGEPGDWNRDQPIRDLLARAEKAEAMLDMAVRDRCRHIPNLLVSEDEWVSQKLADLARRTQSHA